MIIFIVLVLNILDSLTGEMVNGDYLSSEMISSYYKSISSDSELIYHCGLFKINKV